MVDNFDKVIPLIHLDNEGDVLFVEVIQRGKDVGKTGERLIKDYHIHSVDQLLDKKEEIVTMCNAFHARAYIRLNRCNIDVANTIAVGEVIRRDVQRRTAILNGNKPPKIVSLVKVYGSILGSLTQKAGDGINDDGNMDAAVEPKATRKWIVDVDAPEDGTTLEERIAAWEKVINEQCSPLVDKKGNPVGSKIIARIPSKSGMHLVTKPFNKCDFGNIIGTDTNGDSFIKSSGITNLYIGD